VIGTLMDEAPSELPKAVDLTDRRSAA
jgi:hypothetical protein